MLFFLYPLPSQNCAVLLPSLRHLSIGYQKTKKKFRIKKHASQLITPDCKKAGEGWLFTPAIRYYSNPCDRATAFNIPLALFMVSSYSLAGFESATSPAPD